MRICTACNHTVFSDTAHHSVVVCNGCGGVQGTIRRGDVAQFVNLHRWHTGEERAEDQRYFDFTILGSEGVSRVHGWFHCLTKDVMQFG